MTDPLPSSPAGTAQKADAFNWDGNALEQGVALALSGGGFRAMLFHTGALVRLNELGVLSRVARISSVSGGSIAAGYLACVWKKLGAPNAAGAFEKFQDTYVKPILSFGRQSIDVSDILTGLLPWTSAAEQVAASYDKYLFNNIGLQDIPDAPRFVFCATNLQTGVLWRFRSHSGDYVRGRLDHPKLALSKRDRFVRLPAIPVAVGVGTAQEASPIGWDSRRRRGLWTWAFRARVLLSDGGAMTTMVLNPFRSADDAPGQRRRRALRPYARCRHRPHPPTAARVRRRRRTSARALRRRELIDRFQASAKIQPNQTDPYARFERTGASIPIRQGRACGRAALRRANGRPSRASVHAAQRSRRRGNQTSDQLGLRHL